MRPSWIRIGLNPTVPIRRKNVISERRRRETEGEGMWPWWQRLEWCTHKPSMAGPHQKLGKGKGYSPTAFKGSMALPIPNFWLPVFRTLNKNISVLSQPVCGALLGSPGNLTHQRYLKLQSQKWITTFTGAHPWRAPEEPMCFFPRRGLMVFLIFKGVWAFQRVKSPCSGYRLMGWRQAQLLHFAGLEAMDRECPCPQGASQQDRVYSLFLPGFPCPFSKLRLPEGGSDGPAVKQAVKANADWGERALSPCQQDVITEQSWPICT